MKKLYIILVLLMAVPSYFFTASAIKAYPHPITVIQPDGSSLTIQLHGDEFLNWTTCNGKLVQQAKDGFYYYASFNADGSTTLSKSRASSSGMNSIASMNTSHVEIPASLIQAAKIKREAARVARASDFAMGKKKFLVILVEFQDLSFTVSNPQNAFSRLLNEKGYSENGGTGSSYDYYYDNSNGQFDPSFDVYGPFKANGRMSSYGTDRASYAFAEACQNGDSQINFADYDLDNDGVIDNIFFYYAGYNQAEGGGDLTIWPHQWEFHYHTSVRLDGKRLKTYACTSEYSGYSGSKKMAGIGTFTHEFGHVIGLPDFYDTDYEQNGQAPGLSNLSLMDAGPYNNNGKTPPYMNAIEKVMVGWMKSVPEWTESGQKTIEPAENHVAFYTPTSNPGEYFVYEYRGGNGWDKYIGATGLAIYQVDASQNKVGGITAENMWKNWRSYNAVNTYASHECCNLIESYPGRSQYSNPKELLFPGRQNKTEFNASSNPAAVEWNGAPTGYNLSNIKEEGGVLTLMLHINNYNIPNFDEYKEAGINAIYSPKESYSNGDTFEFILLRSNNSPSKTEWYFDDQKQTELSVTLTTGVHTVKAKLTYENGAIETLTVKLDVK